MTVNSSKSKRHRLSLLVNKDPRSSNMIFPKKTLHKFSTTFLSMFDSTDVHEDDFNSTLNTIVKKNIEFQVNIQKYK